MRGRGLKLILIIKELANESVAPHAGAWIETTNGTLYTSEVSVAPHAGAWIETICRWIFFLF